MAICGATCGATVTLPASYTGGCGIQSRPGGIKRVWFAKCDADWDLSSDAAWTAAQTAGDVVGSGLIMGQKGKGSFTKKRISSCSPEGIIGAEKSMTFQDYNIDTVTGAGGCLAYTFWNQILSNAGNYRMIYESCDGYVYGFIDGFILEIDEVIEDNNTGSTYFDGTIMWNDIEMACPLLVDSVGHTGVTPI